MSNELVNKTTGELMNNEQVVNETDNYIVYKQDDGKYRKEMKYKRIMTWIPNNEEDKKELYKVLNEENNELVKTMGSEIDKEIEIEHVFMTPYESFDENTGRNTLGVTTTVKTPDNEYYVTSSKTVYYSLLNMFETFGYPSQDNYKPIKVRITGTRRQNGTQINLVLV